jgi:hypothetical protein
LRLADIPDEYRALVFGVMSTLTDAQEAIIAGHAEARHPRNRFTTRLNRFIS